MSSYENKILEKIEIGPNKSLHFMITVRNRIEKFAQIRVYLESTSYTGYTRSGIILSRNQLQRLRNILCNKDVPKDSDKIGTIDSGKGPTIIIRRIKDKYTKFKPMIDIREYARTKNYEGWTKNGFRIAMEDIEKTTQYIDELESELREGLQYGRIHIEESEIVSKIRDEFNSLEDVGQ